MLKLTGITKEYIAGNSTVKALKGIDIAFRKNEFVSILGPSGCGKTTLLNIIGGLDRYTEGDLSILGKSTKQFTESDWDAYRNHSIGFVFQTYNLIPHQTVLSNVELALTLSGVSKTERKKKAIEALTKVGLGDQLKKKPNQMSGGQMQRVAIARALVNDPEILLADEPTGALDTETSLQVMEILKEVAKDRLVIMVTHNPELAETYSTRIIRLLDGKVTTDSNPYQETEEDVNGEQKKNDKKPSMSFFTALSLSLNNLLTKKTRTFLTAFAGSIGIIGIALILSMSTGINNYINDVQEDTLSSYPIEIQAETVDMTALITSLMSVSEENNNASHEDNAVYENAIMYDLMNTLNSTETEKNNLKAFKEFLDKENNTESSSTNLSEYASAIQYQYDLDLSIYTKDGNGTIVKSDAQALMQEAFKAMYGTSELPIMSNNSSSPLASSQMQTYSVWQELLAGEDGALINDLVLSQYDVIAGKWPTQKDEVVLIVDKNNELSDLVLYSLGKKTSTELIDSLLAASKGEQIYSERKSWSYEEILNTEFKILLPCEQYGYNAVTNTYSNLTKTESGLNMLYASETAIPLKIVGIIRQNKDATAGMITGSLGYTQELTNYLIDRIAESEIVKKQMTSPETDILTGLPFKTEENTELPENEKIAAVKDYFSKLSNMQKAEIYIEYKAIPTQEYLDAKVIPILSAMDRATLEQNILQQYPEYSEMLKQLDDETLFSYMASMLQAQFAQEYAAKQMEELGKLSPDILAAQFDAEPFADQDYLGFYDTVLPQSFSDATYEEVLTEQLGYIDASSPSVIRIYASTFEAKDRIAAIITDYNNSVAEIDQISYTDYVKLLMSSITTIINAISYVLIAFVAVSLVVSSIMIGIITYISVLERTKEIGILRSIGASKKDISRVFNAETMIVGFSAGLIGILLTVLLCIPINMIIHSLTNITAINATLPPLAGLFLVGISMILTIIAGLIPAKLAAKKDPVVALRTE